MTALVAILNQSAVALAADSAMTFGDESSQKIYPVNKVFTLSKFHPVGIMIYNNVGHMGVPFETIIKMYRQRERDHSEPTIKEYAERFLEYLLEPRFCTQEQVSINVQRIMMDAFHDVKTGALEKIKNQFIKSGKMPKLHSRYIEEIIRARREKFEAVEDSESLHRSHRRTIVSRYESEFNAAVKAIFETLKPALIITQANRLLLRALAKLAIVKNVFTDSHTGIVIAGFGANEMFPTLVEFSTDGVIEGALKFKQKDHIDIDRKNTGCTIRAFAQTEMVARFMSGIDPLFELYIREYVKRAMGNLAKEIVDSHVNGTRKTKNTIIRGISTTIEEHVKYLKDYSDKLKYDKFECKVLDAVEHMPKPELAHMAEALVNLTSIKRRVSAELETVGGPIDVAVISKGDGFVWIKRKHYFKPELNKDFMYRYFDEEPTND